MKIQIIYCHPSNKSYTFEIYGSPRIATALNKTKHLCKATIGRYMKRMRITEIRKTKYRITTDSNHNYAKAPNLLNWQYQTTRIISLRA